MKGSWSGLLAVTGVIVVLAYVELLVSGVTTFGGQPLNHLRWLVFLILVTLVLLDKLIIYLIDRHDVPEKLHHLHIRIGFLVLLLIVLGSLFFIFAGLAIGLIMLLALSCGAFLFKESYIEAKKANRHVVQVYSVLAFVVTGLVILLLFMFNLPLW